jgi:Holliday junction resolvase
MPSKQKAKGNNFERTIAKHLGDVFGYNFERVPTSGAMTGGLNSHVLKRLSGSQQLLLEGDLIPPDELTNLKIECKSLKKISFSSFLTENKTLDSWIDQAKSNKKVWFLIFKINNRGTFVAMHEYYFNQFKIKTNYTYYNNNYIVPMTGFFEDNKFKILKLAK